MPAVLSGTLRCLATGLLLATVSACTDRTKSPVVPDALAVGTNQTIFAVSTRSRNPDGTYGSGRADGFGLLELTVSIPPGREPGSLSFGYDNPDPERDFVIAERKDYADRAAFSTRIRKELNTLPSGQREISVFVHGYNATQAETAYRAAQIAVDLGVPGVKTIYSWPSKGQALGYVYDHDSMLFARDGLEVLLRGASRAGADRLVIVAHSMGSLLTLETLRQIEIAEPGWTERNIGGVVLISPDVDIDVFQSQIERVKALPQPFVVFVSQEDKALNLSSKLRGTPKDNRLGTLSDADAVANLPVTIIDTTDFSNEADSSHLVAVTSPSMVALLRQSASTVRTFDTGRGQIVVGNARSAVYTRVPYSSEDR